MCIVLLYVLALQYNSKSNVAFGSGITMEAGSQRGGKRFILFSLFVKDNG